MKTETKYVCEYCGNKFLTEEECQICEQSHHIPEKIGEARYSKGFKFPDTIRVDFVGEHHAIYKYLKPIPRKDGDSNGNNSNSSSSGNH